LMVTRVAEYTSMSGTSAGMEVSPQGKLMSTWAAVKRLR
jgi:hypothetical protein